MTREEKWLLEEKYNGVAGPEFEADQRRLASGEPAAYVIGWQPFLGLKIYLDSKPLIPRVETEWWAEQLANVHKWSGESRFLDLCAGSGAIGCGVLKSVPNAKVFFSEIDPAHEATIRKNIRENALDENRTSIGIGDLFAPFENKQFDFIAANPPYVPQDRALPQSVDQFEPALALRSGADGLDLIRRMAKELSSHLAPGGQAWIECDSAHAAAAAALFIEEGFEVEIRPDQFEKPRVLVVS